MQVEQFLWIARVEVKKAVRKHPTWGGYAQDLYQDACEALVRYQPDNGPFARVTIRGAIVRCVLRYLYVNERTKRPLGMRADFDFDARGGMDPRFAEYEGADELRDMRRRKEGRVRKLAASISRRKPIEHRMSTIEMYYRYKTSGERMEDIAKDYGITRAAVSLRLAVAERDLKAAA